MRPHNKKTGCIYMIFNVLLKKPYIGQTVMKPTTRWACYCDHATKQSNNELLKDIATQGIENFTFQIIESNIPKEKLDDKEKYYIKKYKANEIGYNKTIGGNSTVITMKLSKSDVEEIVKLLLANKSYNEIAAIFDVDVSTISDINHGDTWHMDDISYPIRETNLKRRFFTPQEIDDIYERLEKGYSATEIGKTYNTSAASISKINNGQAYRRENKTYPICNPRSKPLNLNIDVVKKIVTLLETTKDNYVTIARNTHIGRKTISGINKGLIYKSKLNEMGYNEFPIRK